MEHEAMNDDTTNGGEAQTRAPKPAGVTEAAKPAAHSRRVFLFKLSLLLNGAIGAVLAVPIVGYLLAPALKKRSNEEAWIAIGLVGDYPEGETRLASFRNPVTTQSDGITGNIPCWVRHIAGERFQVFAINCAHLNCPVRWFAQSRLFLCPCHGGAYYEDGSRASGPPERGLFEYEHKIVGGQLMIYAGKMPTLSAHGCTKKTLTQIETSSQAKAAAPESGAGASAGSASWPA
jgi:menaquinol-cytochrome c reductase iron-sulfur subunit